MASDASQMIGDSFIWRPYGVRIALLSILGNVSIDGQITQQSYVGFNGIKKRFILVWLGRQFGYA